MEILIDVIIEVASILIMGIACFIIYVYSKLFLIKIGFIKDNQFDDPEKGNKND
tara:strand:- start:626 stop:787 length:162 start_codon:yes stop_codon:yes gene_type:complete